MTKNSQPRYSLDPKGLMARIAMICLFLSVISRAVGGVLNRTVFEDRVTLVEFLLPIVCCLLYILCIALFGRKGFWVSVIPFLCGMMAFVIRLFSYDNLLQEEVSQIRTLISIFYYLVATAVYSSVVVGGFHAKWLLFFTMLVPLAAHGWFDIYPVIIAGEGADPSAILMEISVIMIILGMLFASAGLSRKRKVTEVKPESGKTVVPPIPGNKLDGKPPVVSDVPEEEKEEPKEESSDVSEEESGHEPEIPDETESASIPDTTEAVSEAETAEEPENISWTSYTAESEPEEASEPEKASEPEEEAYDPFAPSTEPIRLTLNPEGFTTGTDEMSDEDGRS